MRFIVLSLLCFLGFQGFSQPTDRLRAWFCFDSTALNDCSGNGSIGTPVNDPVITCGVLNSAARLDGVDDAIIFIGPINDDLGAGDFTLSFFMKPVSQPGTQLVMAKQGDTCDSRPAFSVRYGGSTNSVLVGLAQNDTLQLTLQAKLDEGRCWQHIAITRLLGEVKLYINGVVKDTKSTVSRIDLSSDDILKIGEPICPQDRAFRGDIDELRLYTRSLKISEVKELADFMPDRILNRDTLIFLGNSFDIKATKSCATAYEWINDEGVSDIFVPNPTITPVQTSVYSLAFKHATCIAYDSVVVTVVDPSTLDCTEIFIPNAFTPGNSSGLNDEFIISNPFAIAEFISFEVFDRWGGRVFNASSQFEGWDGTFSGAPLNAGMYLYRLRYKCQGEEIVRNGSVVLLR